MKTSSKLGVKAKMIAAFGIIIVFVIVLVIVALYSISRIKIIQTQLDHSHNRPAT